MIGLHLEFGQDELVANWVASQIPHVAETGFGPCSAIAIVVGNKPVAGVVYHDWHPAQSNCQLSMAAVSPVWARFHIVAGLLHYPFMQMNCYKVWTATPLDNTLALRVNERLGFRREATLAHQFGPKRHAVICRLLKPDYIRLYGAEHGQELSISSRSA